VAVVGVGLTHAALSVVFHAPVAIQLTRTGALNTTLNDILVLMKVGFVTQVSLIGMYANLVWYEFK